MQPSCVFPSCAEFGVLGGASGRQFCAHCGRPLGGPTFGPPPRYRMEAFLDSGYYADVFRAVDLASGTTYAAKLYQNDPLKRQAAAREVDALQRLSHPRLPVLQASFQEGEWIFVVMELVPGSNLRQEVALHGPLAVDRVLKLGIDACAVFEYLACRHWTYRDLHPKNMHRATPKGTMIIDLDGARPAHWPAQPAGRIGYRAPELEQNEEVSPACDMFSLAGCLSFALTGEDPPEQPGPLHVLRGLLASLPQLADLIDGCRRADPAQRPGAHAVRTALELLATQE